MKQPAKWLLKALRWYCSEELIDAIEGDLLELYQRRRKNMGRIKANVLFLWNVVCFFQPFAFRTRTSSHLFATIDLIISYFTIAWRALKTHKSYSLINILGLSVGLAATIVIIRYVVDEITYDSFHSRADKIFRINYSYDTRGETTTVAKTAFPLKPYLLENYPEITQIVRFYKNTQYLTTLSYKDKIYTEENVMFSDPNVFEVFDFKLTKGDPNTALSSANSIVLTQQAASKYFGSEDPMGKVIKFQNEDKLVISGVLEEIPGNSHLKFDILLPIELQRQRWMRDSENNGYDLEKDWKWSGSWSYLYIENPENLQAVKQRLYEEGADFFGRLTNSKITYLYDLQNLRDIHLGMTMAGAVAATGNKFEVYGFLVIAMLILFIACINFINLSTARSVQRAKEVGLRKVFGAFRKQLIHQFITESILITLISACVGLFILELLLPYFNDFTNKVLTIPYNEYPQIILIIFLGVLLVGVLAGLYPSIYLSRFQPVRALKGNKEPYIHGFGMRKLLVLTQFIVTNVLIISILIIKSQLSFIKGKDLGFDKEQIIVLKHGRKLSDEFHQLKEQLLNHSLIANVDRGYVAGKRGWTQSFRINGEDRTESKGMGIKHVSYDFLDMYNLKLIAGRNFDRKHSTDSTSAILINEATLRILGWDAHEALGQTFSWIGGSDNRTRYEVKVIGILADANFESLYEQVRPSVFKLDNFGEIAIKLAVENKEQLKAAIEVVESAWNNVSPEWPFEFTFLDQEIEEQYLKDERMARMIQFFGLLAIFIASMGLFGLASFTVAKRRKEIGVRKVLGASARAIFMSISQEFFLLVLVAFFIAIPIGYFLSAQWLQNFVFKIEIGEMIFIFSGVISLLIALIAVSAHTIEATLTNPVEALKNE